MLKGTEIEVKYIQPGVASVEEVIEAKRVLEKVKDLSDEERETLAKLGVSAVRFIEPNNTITVNTQNEFTTRPSSRSDRFLKVRRVSQTVMAQQYALPMLLTMDSSSQ